MKTLLAIMAHGEAQATYDRHSNWWHRLGHDMLTFSPTDDPVRPNFGTACVYGKAQQWGPLVVDRWRNLLRVLSVLHYDRYVLLEYDALVLAPIPWHIMESKGVWSNEYQNTEGDRWKASFYMHFPLVADADSLKTMAANMHKLDDTEAAGFIDRWLAWLIESNDIPHHPLGKLGYSRNTIDLAHYCEEAKQAAREQAIFWHGIKSEDCLKMILDARAESVPA